MTDILNRMKEQQGLQGRARDIVGKMLQMSSGQQKNADKLQEEGTVFLSHVTAVKNDEREDLLNELGIGG